MKKIFSETIKPRALIFGMWTLTKFVQIMPLGPIMARPQGSHVLHRLIEVWKNLICSRALIFGM